MGIDKYHRYLISMVNLFFFAIISLIIVGGDGSVIDVINALIRYLTKENRTR